MLSSVSHDSVNSHSCTGVQEIMAICCKHTANFTYVVSQTGFHPQSHSWMESKCNGFFRYVNEMLLYLGSSTISMAMGLLWAKWIGMTCRVSVTDGTTVLWHSEDVTLYEFYVGHCLLLWKCFRIRLTKKPNICEVCKTLYVNRRHYILFLCDQYTYQSTKFPPDKDCTSVPSSLLFICK